MTYSQKFPEISAPELKARLISGDEIAVLDVRDVLTYATEGHLFAGISLPLDRIEVDIAEIVPRRNTPVIIHAGSDDGPALRAASALAALGYSDITLLPGGTKAWSDAGFELFTGVNVIGIAFGEYVEEESGTPHVSASELKNLLDRNENVVVLDSRPHAEFNNFSVPGAHDLPGAELVYRFEQVVTDPDALVVVNCAGRTRSIIGAQALINAGVRNKVVSLANGTMDWLMNGHALDTGRRPILPSAPDPATAGETLERLRKRFPISYIASDVLSQFRQEHEAGQRTLYIFDVRSSEEYLRGHLPGARSIPGGQLVQQVDHWASTRNARIVLVDSEDLVRSSITASWLLQINWGEVHVLTDSLSGPLAVGPEPRKIAGAIPAVKFIDVSEVDSERPHITIIDVDTSLDYRNAHVPGAYHGLRTWLTGNSEDIPGDNPIVLTSADGALAAFAAADLQPLTSRPVKVLDGGTSAWQASGRTVETGEQRLLHSPVDRRKNPYEAETEDARFAGFKAYLAWELGLPEQLRRDGTSQFRLL